MAFIGQPLSVALVLLLLLNLLSFRLHMDFVLTELASGVNISGLIGKDTQRPSSWQEGAGYFS